MSYADPTPEDHTFNAEYVELVTLAAGSVTDVIQQLARDNRRSASYFADRGDQASANSLLAAARTYEHTIDMLDLAWNQAMARVARQVTA